MGIKVNDANNHYSEMVKGLEGSVKLLDHASASYVRAVYAGMTALSVELVIKTIYCGSDVAKGLPL